MRNVVKKLAVVVSSALILCACSTHYASNRDKQYLDSRNGKQLVVPPPLTTSNISHFYDLPQREKSAAVSITPPTNPAVGSE